MLPKLTLADIAVGMEVNTEQLSEIYDTWILLTRDTRNSKTSRIVFIGKEQNEDYCKAFNSYTQIAPIFHDSTLLDEDVCYDE